MSEKIVFNTLNCDF